MASDYRFDKLFDDQKDFILLWETLQWCPENRPDKPKPKLVVVVVVIASDRNVWVCGCLWVCLSISRGAQPTTSSETDLYWSRCLTWSLISRLTTKASSTEVRQQSLHLIIYPIGYALIRHIKYTFNRGNWHVCLYVADDFNDGENLDKLALLQSLNIYNK